MNGLQLDLKKNYLVSWAIHPGKLAPRVFIPVPPEMKLLVTIGEEVKTAQPIASPLHPNGVYLHASLTGTVKSLVSLEHPRTGNFSAIEIESSGKEIFWEQTGQEKPDWMNEPSDSLLATFQRMGLVTLDDRAEPLHAKIALRHCLDEDTLLISACESEPYVTSQQSLVMSHPLEVLKGAELLRKAYGAGRVVVMIEAHKSETLELLRSKIYFLKWEHFQVQGISSNLYPQDLEKNLRNHFLPQASVPTTVVFEQAATAFAVFEAVAKQKPLIERAVSVAGECVPEAKNVWLRIGTPLETAFKNCKGLLREPSKVVLGGPMRGDAALNLQFPVFASTNAVLALAPEVAQEHAIEPCIRCGRCADVCPEDLLPSIITLAAEERDHETAEAYNVQECTECGNCAYVCPSKRPMVELIQSMKPADTLGPSKKNFRWAENEKPRETITAGL